MATRPRETSVPRNVDRPDRNERTQRPTEADHVKSDPARMQEDAPVDLFPEAIDIDNDNDDDEETQEYVDLDADNLHDRGY